MITKRIADAPPVTIDKDGFRGMQARFVLTADDGCPRYAMRVMEFAAGGYTSLHAHAEEHEFYMLEGEASLVGSGGERLRLSPGEFAYVAPGEAHQLRNEGAGVMRILCTIPILAGGDGKHTRAA